MPEDVGEVDVFLVAEDHGVANHSDIEMYIISSLEPEYVVVEDSPSDKDVARLMELFDKNSTLYNTEKHFAEKYGESFLSTNPETIYSESLDEIEPENSDNGIIPDSFGEFITTPVYELHSEFLGKISNSIKDYEGQIREDSESLNAAADGGMNMRESLDEIEQVYEHIDNVVSKYSGGLPRQFDALKTLVDRDELEVVSENNEFMDRRFSNIGKEVLRSGRTWQEVVEELRKIEKGRQRCVGETIAEHARKSDDPVVGIIGTYHAREPSEIYPELEAENLSYRTVWLEYEEPFKNSVEEYLSGTRAEYILPSKETDEKYKGPVEADTWAVETFL